MRGGSRSPRLGRRPDGGERGAGRAGGVAGVTALVDVESRGAVAVITLRQEEKLNALSSKVERELAEALRDEPVRGSASVIVTGGARASSAGADVNEMRDLDPASILAYYRETGGVYERLYGFAAEELGIERRALERDARAVIALLDGDGG